MKKAIFAIAIIWASCSNNNKSIEQSAQQKESTNEQRSAKKDTIKVTPKAPDALAGSSNAEMLIGKWAAKGQNGETLEIKKTTVFYPSHPINVPYKIIGDSIKMELEKGYFQSFAFKLKGSNNLTLVDNEGEITELYRIKGSASN